MLTQDAAATQCVGNSLLQGYAAMCQTKSLKADMDDAHSCLSVLADKDNQPTCNTNDACFVSITIIAICTVLQLLLP